MKQKCNNDMEQRSEKVQKLLDEKPSWFMMWGIPILLILLMVIVFSRSLKSAHLRDIVRKQYSADFFNKPQKNPHGSFEVVCSGS